jgi:hypothetical protein
MCELVYANCCALTTWDVISGEWTVSQYYSNDKYTEGQYCSIGSL